MKQYKKNIQRVIGCCLIGSLILQSGCVKAEPATAPCLEFVQMESLPEECVKPTQEQLLEEYIQSMTLEEKVGQMFYVTIGNLSQPEQENSNSHLILTEPQLEHLREYQPGGVILMGGNIQSDDQVLELTTSLQQNSKIPLFIGVDEEGGMVSRLGNSEGISMSNVGTMQSIGNTGDVQNAYEIGESLAEGVTALGFNMDFAPVADVLTNPYNYEIGSRSFGSDAETVADMIAVEISGLQEHGVSAVVKHFPGHGDVVGNSHTNLQYVDTPIDILKEREFIPFEEAIQAETDAILVSHLVLKAVDDENPSTLSQPVVTGLLREELGYDGVVITDSFQMGSITTNYTQEEAAVLAVQAGCDMILMPAEYEACYQSVLQAVQDERISEEQIDASCMRILKAKAERGILILE